MVTINNVFRRTKNMVFSRNSALFSNAFFLMLNSVITSFLGFIFWNVMARYFPADQVGIGSTLVTGSMLLGNLSNLGLGLGLIRFVPEDEEMAPHLVNLCFTITGAVAVVVSLIYLVVMRLTASVKDFMAGNSWYEIYFILFTAATALSMVIDQALLAKSSANYVFWKNFIVCLLKIPIPVFILAKLEGYGIFASTGIAILAGIFLSFFFFLPRAYGNYLPKPQISTTHLKLMLSFSFFNYLAHLFSSGPGLIYPTLVLNVCGSDDSAYFYIAWMMAMVLAVVPTGMSQSLFAAGSQKPDELQHLARRSLGFSLLLSSLGLGAMFIAGGWFLRIFGNDYYENGSKLLWILSASVIPQCITSSFLAINQVRKDMKLITAQSGISAAIALGLGLFLLKKMGPQGLAWGYFIAQLAVAILVHRPLLSALHDSGTFPLSGHSKASPGA